jgi:hypothetical protein
MSSQSLQDQPALRPSASATPITTSEQAEGNTDTSTPDDNDNDATTEDTAAGDLPMSMSASVILTNLPKDASHALALVDELDDFKGMRFYFFPTTYGWMSFPP